MHAAWARHDVFPETFNNLNSVHRRAKLFCGNSKLTFTFLCIKVKPD